MKKIFSCVLLACVMMLAGCSIAPLQRGLDPASGAFVSTARPAVSIQPAEGFSALSSGATLCRVPVDNGMFNTVAAEVWYSLFKKDGAQLVTMLAECDTPWQWSVGAMGKDYYYLPLLYKYNSDMADAANVVVYVRAAARDPWMPQFSADGTAGETPLLVARYEWMDSSDNVKVITEYRESVEGLEEGQTVPSEQVKAFLDRSQKAFSLGGAPQPVNMGKAPYVNIADRVLAPMIGAVSLPLMYERFQ